MKKFYSVALALIAAVLCMPVSWAAKHRADEKPIVTIHSDAYKVIGEANAYQIRLGSDMEAAYFEIDYGSGPEEVLVEPWGFNNGSIKATNVAIHVEPEGIIKIYGDASKLAYLDIEGIYATEVEMSACTELQAIDFSHNELKGLDLTPFTKLMAIYLTTVYYTPESPLIVGAPKNDLVVLDISGAEYIDDNFNLSDYPNLLLFDAYHARGLKKLDPTGCPALQYITLDMTDVATLDVTKNTELLSLDISNTLIKDIDLSKNTKLQKLMIDHQSAWINPGARINSLDLTNNPNLTLLAIAENWLTELDLTKNPKLTNINLKNNSLTTLDLSQNKDLYSVTLTNNNMSFATLPAPQPTWGEYFYEQQNIPVARSFKVGDKLDLSDKVLREGTTTTAKVMLKTSSGVPEEYDATKYTYKDGVVTFNEAIADTAMVYYYNSLLTEYPMFTTRFVVKTPEEFGKPAQMVSFNTTKGSEVNISLGVAGATPENPKKVYVSYGDGELVEYTVTTHKIPEQVTATGTVSGSGKVIIYVDDDNALSAMGMDGVKITSIDVTKATELAFLSITNCELRTINLIYNRCLQTLDLSHNRFAALDLSGASGSQEKNVLTDINVSYNQLKSFKIMSTRCTKRLNVSHNLLETYSFTNFDSLEELDISYNQLIGELSLTYPLEIKKINISNNKLSTLKYDTFELLTDLNLTNNLFTYQTLPYFPNVANYTYAPQSLIELVPNAPAINLTDQNRVIDGKGTTFVWKNEAGQTLVQGVDIDCVNGGTKFLKEDLGKVYCEMTNPAFPQFSGENILKTSLVQVVGKSTKVVASFTTVKDADNGTLIMTGYKKGSLVIDWRGDGTEYIPYEFIEFGTGVNGINYTTYNDIQTYANANVKVYTYDDIANLRGISFTNIEMSEFDGTPMTSIIHLNLSRANLPQEKMKLPKANLQELNLESNQLETYPFMADYPNLKMLNLGSNKLTEIDLSSLKSLEAAYLGNNEITSVKFDNPVLWHVGLELNKLTEVNLNGLPKLDQLLLPNNQLETIDLTPVKNTVRNLMLNYNKFTFATLPLPKDLPALTRYIYSNQARLEAKVSDDFMTYDLSSQAVIDGVESEYTWFLGQPVYDAEDGSLSGEVLYEGEEYEIKNGVTTFKTKFNDVVVCVITNSIFPSAFLWTNPYTVGFSGIDSVVADEEKLVDVYTVYGMRVKTAVPESEACDNLAPGFYIVGKKKVYVK